MSSDDEHTGSTVGAANRSSLDSARRTGWIGWLFLVLGVLSIVSIIVLVPLALLGLLPNPAIWLVGWACIELGLLLVTPLAFKKEREAGGPRRL